MRTTPGERMGFSVDQLNPLQCVQGLRLLSHTQLSGWGGREERILWEQQQGEVERSLVEESGDLV